MVLSVLILLVVLYSMISSFPSCPLPVHQKDFVWNYIKIGPSCTGSFSSKCKVKSAYEPKWPIRLELITVSVALRWLNTVFARILLMWSSARTRIAKTNISSIEWSFYLFKTHTICAIFLQYWTQCIDDFSLLLQRYVKNGNNVKNPAILSFSLLPKEPT